MLMRTTSVVANVGRMTCLAAALLLGFACTGEPGEPGEPGPTGAEGPEGPEGTPGELDPNLSTWDKVLAGVGGQAALEGLTGVTIEASGMRHVGGEGYSHEDGAATVDLFDTAMHVDMVNDAMRIDWNRELLFLGAQLSYSEIVNGNLGVVDGVDNLLGPPTGDMPSGRWASVRKQAMLLNPHAVLALVNGDPSLASEGGAALYNGAIHETLVVQDSSNPMLMQPITLYVNASTGRVAKLSVMENDHLHRDIPLEVHFLDWADDDNGGAAFPMSVYLTVNGQIWHEEYRTSVAQNPTFTTEFDFPAGAMPAYDEAGAMWGMNSHQFIQGFNSLGITQNVEQLTVVPEELAQGVYLLGGSSHNSMAIEQESGVVILEAPLYPERSEAILAWVDATFNGKPVTHLVITHHHHDHSSGFRSFVAAGAALVTGEESAGFYRELARRPSTIVPDSQATAMAQANVIAVAKGDNYLIAGAPNATARKGDSDDKGLPAADVEVIGFDSAHSNDMLMAHVQMGDGYLFQSDLFNPAPTGGFALAAPFAQQFLDAIMENGLAAPTLTLVGGHGTYAPLCDLEAYLGGTACPVP